MRGMKAGDRHGESSMRRDVSQPGDRLQASGGHESIDFSTTENTPAIVLVEALARVQSAYVSFYPRDAVTAPTFFEQLRALLLQFSSRPGMSWSAVGDKLWTPLMMQLDRAFGSYRCTMITAPSLDAETHLSPATRLLQTVTQYAVLAESKFAALEAAMASAKLTRGRTRGSRERKRGPAEVERERKPGARVDKPPPKKKAKTSATKRGGKRKRESEESDADAAGKDDDASDGSGGGGSDDRTRSAKEHWCKNMNEIKALAAKLKTKERLCAFYYSHRGCRHANAADCAFTHEL